MALFSSAVDTFVFSFPIPRFLFRKICSTTEMLPAKEAWRISLRKLHSLEFGKGEFCELRLYGVLRSWPRRQAKGVKLPAEVGAPKVIKPLIVWSVVLLQAALRCR